ncbi:helix-turn-helix domain-containing protein, partial [Staphylococcus aureus]
MAAATGLTKGFLSEIERDKASPSVASLVALCDVLGVPVGSLFEAPAPSAVVRVAERAPIRFGGTGIVDHLR